VLKLPCMFEDGCLFYTLANFYREQSNLKGIVFELKCSCRRHRIKISNRRATQRCNVSAFFYAKICSLLARRQSNQPVQRVYWPENVIDWLGKWRPTYVMRHARGQKLQSFRRKWPFYMDLYSMSPV
jgi:hypothetical protein